MIWVFKKSSYISGKPVPGVVPGTGGFKVDLNPPLTYTIMAWYLNKERPLPSYFYLKIKCSQVQF
jgi:hypothetical protein